jgi:thiamine kinase-like enzyme
VVERLIALPVTFIHGEFYASNVLVESNGRTRICPIDWEMAGIGPSLIDLAALASGKWTDERRTELAAAYLDAAPSAEFLADLDCCLLHLAVQWLGWSADWQPPAEHAHDWAGEAVRLAEKLGL